MNHFIVYEHYQKDIFIYTDTYIVKADNKDLAIDKVKRLDARKNQYLAFKFTYEAVPLDNVLNKTSLLINEEVF